ncbi:CUB and zona pellucida-like domain-containing protein 1 [Elysia marginata]|uniref:CUB and zona pellucida-like domain-containing protein 1 n=1 Tax=Elysia marginata TaxID=1093978 RepID=A0AAV4GK09_9GAST|nr:CUB and zona pellucida-like domain-containing protein 1 [Elysia marginata]
MDHVKLVFENVNLDDSTCQDKIVLYDGNSTSAPILSTICGDQTPVVYSKSNSILLVFTRDASSRGTFSLTYQAFLGKMISKRIE